MLRSSSSIREGLGELIAATPWIDTHEHLLEEADRLNPDDVTVRFYPDGNW